MSETAKDSLQHGDWVRCDGQIMAVSGIGYGKIALIKENAPLIYAKVLDGQYPEVSYYPVEALEKLPEVDVSEAVVRSFFRLETMPWRLCEQGLYPFSDRSGMRLTDEDLQIFAENYPNADPVAMENWISQFAYTYPRKVYCRDEYERMDHLPLCLVWDVIRDKLEWTDMHSDMHKVKPETVSEIVNAYIRSKGKKLSEADVPTCLKVSIIDALEDDSRDGDPTEEEKKAYGRFLDELSAKNAYWALKAARAYYYGNRFVHCDLKKSKQILLTLEHNGNMDAATLLGELYFSTESNVRVHP